MRLTRKAIQSEGWTLFFATDIHGSDVCFKKFVNAHQIYGANTLIMGGDMTGKIAIPLVSQGLGRVSVIVPGTPYTVQEDELEQTETRLRSAGFYPFRTDSSEIDAFRADPSLAEAKMSELMIERLHRWAEWADVRLAGTGVEILVSLGNDDPWILDDAFKETPPFRLIEGQVVRVPADDRFELLTVGLSNRTPWDTPRELDEDDLEERIRGLAIQVRDPSWAVFNLHVPPYDSQLDVAPLLNKETLEVKRAPGLGQEIMVPVGSHAVRAVIEEFQPMLSLHGHIHESRGVVKIGRTLAINPGSDYGDGVLRGALVSVTGTGIRSYQLTAG